MNKTLKPTLKGKRLSAFGTWPAFSLNSALQPQLLKLEAVFDETVKAGTTIQEELKSAILSRCAGGQKSYLNLTIILNFEGASVAMGSFSAEVGDFHGGK